MSGDSQHWGGFRVGDTKGHRDVPLREFIEKQRPNSRALVRKLRQDMSKGKWARTSGLAINNLDERHSIEAASEIAESD